MTELPLILFVLYIVKLLRYFLLVEKKDRLEKSIFFTLASTSL